MMDFCVWRMYYDLHLVTRLLDEGYVDRMMRVKVGYVEVNAFLDGIDDSKRFTSDDELHKFVMDIWCKCNI
jgi:hypothetical protein